MAILRNGVNTATKNVDVIKSKNAPLKSQATTVFTQNQEDKERGLFLLNDDDFLEKFTATLYQLAKEKSKPKKRVYRWFAYSDEYNFTGIDLKKLDKMHFLASNKYEMMLLMLKVASKEFMSRFYDIEGMEISCYESMVSDRYDVDTNDMKQIIKRWFSHYHENDTTTWYEKFEPICA